MIKVNVMKKLGNIKIEVAFNENNEDILVIIGPSGCGKTTMLNLISGVIKADFGVVNINNTIMFHSEHHINLPLNKRNIGYVQQKHNLFPHLNVEKNIHYGRKHKNNIDLNEIIEILEIKNILNKKINELSGGQKQRVAIARALASEPKILLMDEPFSALDNLIREKLRSMVSQINEKFKIPIIFITHDLEESYALGHKIALMDNGKIIKIGTAKEIFEDPESVKVAKFLGIKNILSGKSMDFILDKLSIRIIKENYGENISIALRSENIILIDSISCESSFTGVIIEKINEVNYIKYKVKILENSIILEARVPRRIKPYKEYEKNSNIGLLIHKEDILILK